MNRNNFWILLITVLSYFAVVTTGDAIVVYYNNYKMKDFESQIPKVQEIKNSDYRIYVYRNENDKCVFVTDVSHQGTLLFHDSKVVGCYGFDQSNILSLEDLKKYKLPI